MTMEQTGIRRFIVIDDDAISNHICRKGIEIRFKDADVKTFLDPVAGIDHIITTGKSTSEHNTTLFLDINMPEVSGWMVLDQIADLPQDIKQHLDIYMLSSSVDADDKRKAANTELVSGYIEKPLTISQLQKIFPFV